MSESPLITVYITTKNRIELLKRAINSVFEQTYNNVELLIVNDGSTDDTRSFLNTLSSNHSNVRVFHNETSIGACASRNIAIFNSTGKYITGLDDDDEFVETRLDILIKAYDSQYSFVCSNFIDRYDSKDILSEKLVEDRKYVFDDLKIANCSASQILTETEKLRDIGGFDPEVKRLQDWDTWFRLSNKFGDFLKLKEPLYIMHHEHEISRVSKSYPFPKALLDFYEKHKGFYSANEKIYFKSQIKYLENNFGFKDLIISFKVIGIFRAVKWLLFSLWKRN